MELLDFLMRDPNALPRPVAQGFAAMWTVKSVPKGATLAQQGQPQTDEFALLDGTAVSEITDDEGRSVCVGLYAGPCVITPHVARTFDGTSMITITARSDVLVAQMPAGNLSHLMLTSVAIRDWANAALRAELGRKVAREWCLAALGGADRLAWFRRSYPTYENLFPHHMIASFIGVTPVTFSRLRTSAQN